MSDAASQNQRVALVTGAGAGIGLAIARRLAADGYRVALNDLDPDAADSAAAGLGSGHLAAPGDVANEADVERIVSEVVARWGRLDVLVNNAGIGDGAVPALEQDLERFHRTMAVHADGCFLVSRTAARAMIAPPASRGGAIVNLSSVAGQVAIPNRIGYAAAKGAIVMMTKVLACEWAGHGIRVNAVAPGYVRTALVDGLIRSGKIDEDGVLARTPLRRLARPEEIAAVVAFLAGPDASYVTGAVLPVDGGYLAYGAPFDTCEYGLGSPEAESARAAETTSKAGG
ncbi:MAG: glucose 1-dehydrogenase [Rhodobiaceae bacterium]|nr:glucose 1-dehydrogenase [Rhodobiaceae bacterium]MCC0017424.1 glucose 1-dehydrogenase [Rhodobiaceae bacterium]MCC0042633.1 glucose 1-dehydrogenase [Rhodobiaceae bacterium]